MGNRAPACRDTRCNRCALSDQKVLVVDDESDIRLSLAMILDLSGFPADTAANGQEALDYLNSHPLPGAIILDLNMPVMNGMQFREAQQAAPRLAAIPVVVCSARSDMQDSAATPRRPGLLPQAVRPARAPWRSSAGATRREAARSGRFAGSRVRSF